MLLHSLSPAALVLAGACALGSAPVASAQQLRVGLCAAAGTVSTCQWLDVQTRLMATGRFVAVDIINVAVATPTLAQLLPYDALMCWTNLTPVSNTAWGDVLANYVDAGGGVVVTVFANSTTTAGRNIGGRWQTGYEVILDQSGNASGAGGVLGVVSQPAHPVMAGVTAFAGGTIGSRPTGTALEVGASLIAQWSDGKVLAAVGANPRRVDLGFFPPHSSCSQSGWSTGGDLLMANALEHVASFGRFIPYGAGCAGSLGVPALSNTGGVEPALGAAFGLTLANLPVGFGTLVIGISDTVFGPLPLPLDLGILNMPGCSLLTDIALTFQMAGNPSASIALPIPNDIALIDGIVFSQGFALDPPANPTGLTTSNGGKIRFGF